MTVSLLSVLIPVSLLMLLLVPRKQANRHVKAIRRVTVSVIAVQLVIACTCFAWLQLQPAVSAANGNAFLIQEFSDSLSHYDGVSGLMFLLVSFVGVVVSRFSVRYLDGDANQGNYFRWLGITLGAVSLLVLAGNLVLFFAAWFMTSYGLHHLLLHFSDRPWARRAAWTKFAISRAGDVFLLSALVLIYREFGTAQLAEILTNANQITESSWQLTLAGWFLVLGAATKSAQFPVHFWLPETMEAPTPVSALMHAGIVNAGGYLLVRWSPVVVHAPAAMMTLAIIGGFTAVFASLVMMTQSNVKRSLGYSTVAQMGFMMLQCGLGAFSAAMLHIIAHSLYKAHAFLRTGDAWRVEQMPGSATARPAQQVSYAANVTQRQLVLGFGVLGAGAITILVAQLLNYDLTAKAGGITLTAIICLAIGSWLAQAAAASWQTIFKTSLAGLALIASYFMMYTGVYHLTHSQVPNVTGHALLGWVGVALILPFIVLALLQSVLATSVNRRWLQVLYVHVSNGFYVDTIIRRTLGLPLTRTPSAS